jgi:hypothetical protein
MSRLAIASARESLVREAQFSRKAKRYVARATHKRRGSIPAGRYPDPEALQQDV